MPIQPGLILLHTRMHTGPDNANMTETANWTEFIFTPFNLTNSGKISLLALPHSIIHEADVRYRRNWQLRSELWAGVVWNFFRFLIYLAVCLPSQPGPVPERVRNCCNQITAPDTFGYIPHHFINKSWNGPDQARGPGVTQIQFVLDLNWMT